MNKTWESVTPHECEIRNVNDSNRWKLVALSWGGLGRIEGGKWDPATVKLKRVSPRGLHHSIQVWGFYYTDSIPLWYGYNDSLLSSLFLFFFPSLFFPFFALFSALSSLLPSRCSSLSSSFFRSLSPLLSLFSTPYFSSPLFFLFSFEISKFSSSFR